MTSVSPNTPSIAQSSSDDVKIAQKDLIILKEDLTPTNQMTDLIFENIGGQELINIARNDIVNGQRVIYQPIKNLTRLNFQYNSINLLSLQDTDSNYFNKFAINFSNKIPVCGTGSNCSIVFLDPTTGDLVINVVNLEADEQVEVEILTSGTIIDDTIYEVE
jgi:hypothetical protein